MNLSPKEHTEKILSDLEFLLSSEQLIIGEKLIWKKSYFMTQSIVHQKY